MKVLIRFLNNLFKKNNFGQFETDLESLENSCFSLKNNFPYVWLIDICYQRKADREGKIFYQFYDGEFKITFTLIVFVDIESEVRSITHLWKNACVFEQEIYENYGVNFTRHYPFFYQEDDDNSSADVILRQESGIQFCGAQIFCHLNECDVKSISLEAGLFHIGIENAVHGKSFRELKQFLEFYYSSLSPLYSMALARMVEDEYSIDIPDRAKALRMVILELNKIYGHIITLGKIVNELQLFMANDFFILYLKKIQSLLVSLSGNEFSRFYVVVGGVLSDVTQDWVSRVVMDLISLEKSLLKLKHNLFESEQNQSILSTIVIDKKEAFDWNITGPIARASGINIDLRKLNPFYFYKDVEFEVPVGVRGSLWDLIDIRIEEIFQSIKIVTQVLDNLPTGNHLILDYLSILTETKNSERIDDALYRKNVEEISIVSNLERSILFEGANGIHGMRLKILDGKIQDFHLFTPARLQKRFFEETTVGKNIEDIIPYWMVMDIDLKEVER